MQLTRSRERDWLMPVCAITALQAALYALVYLSSAAPRPLLLSNSLVAFVALGIYAVVRLVWAIVAMMIRGEREPARRLYDAARQMPPRVAAVVAGVELAAVNAALFSALKAAIPNVVPFWADRPIMLIERALLGDDAWRVAQHWIGWATPGIDLLYILWIAIQLAAIYAVMTLAPSPRKTQAIVCYFLLWEVVGLFAAAAFSSAGPIFYDRIFGGAQFAALAPTLASLHGNAALAASERLWAAHMGLSTSVGAGISAMPSLHVACAVWLALVLRAFLPKVQALGWAYAALIWVGSVLLGWHYALDGPAGALGAILVWRWTPAFSRLFSRAEPRVAVLPEAITSA